MNDCLIGDNNNEDDNNGDDVDNDVDDDDATCEQQLCHLLHQQTFLRWRLEEPTTPPLSEFINVFSE